jgi:predicted nucleotidyltransferase
MLEESVKHMIRKILESRDEIAFAYLHGSSLFADTPRDIDIAVYLFPAIIGGPMTSLQLDFTIPLEREIEKVANKPLDIQILNKAPLPFRFRVVSQGVVILDRSPDMRERFELLSRVEYFDFRPRREAYLKEALA